MTDPAIHPTGPTLDRQPLDLDDWQSTTTGRTGDETPILVETWRSASGDRMFTIWTREEAIS